MSEVLTGTDAFDALNEGTEESTSNAEFTPLRSGSTIIVKVPGLNMISKYVYNSFALKINSFVAKEESKKSAKGYPVEDLTPFDKAWKHHKDQSDDWQDEQSQMSSNFRCQRKFTLGFYDLDTGLPIMIEFTRNQANAVVDTIKKYEKRLGQFAFELSKTGKGTNTVVSLSLIPMLDDLTEKQQANFEKAPNDFDAKNFEGLHYEMDNDEQIETLIRVGFNIAAIGLEAPNKDDGTPGEVKPFENAGEPIDINDEDLPF